MTLASNQTPSSHRKGRLLCGAKTRAGGCCQVRAEPGKARCRFHGGKSTGPKTQAGRARMAEAQRLRWLAYRERVRAVRSGDKTRSERQHAGPNSPRYIVTRSRVTPSLGFGEIMRSGSGSPDKRNGHPGGSLGADCRVAFSAKWPPNG